MNAKEAHVEIATKASERLIKSLPRIKAKHGEYGKLRNRARHPFAPEAKAYREDVKKTYLRHLEKSANELTNRRGTKQYTLKENGKPNTSQYYWNVSTQDIKHVAADGSFRVRPIFDDEGWIVDLKFVDDDMAQTMDRGLDFLIHMGVQI
jgi:threonine aldolase